MPPNKKGPRYAGLFYVIRSFSGCLSMVAVAYSLWLGDGESTQLSGLYLSIIEESVSKSKNVNPLSS